MSALYIQKEGRQWGPFTEEELGGQMATGAFSKEDLYWTEGMEQWLPLSGIVEVEPETDANVAVATAEESPPEEVEEEELADDDGVYFNESGILITLDEITWKAGTLEPVLVAKTSATIEKVRRTKPLIAAVAAGVAGICLALLELPKTTAAHWAIWVGVLVLLFFAMLRMLYSGLRPARSMVVLDMVDGTEYIIPAGPEIAQRVNDCIERAANDSRQRVARI